MKSKCISKIRVNSINWSGSSKRGLKAGQLDLVVNGVKLGRGIRRIKFEDSHSDTLMRPEFELEMVIVYADYLVPQETLQMINNNKII